ncbi:MAG TPA: phospholipase A2 [Smithellaceae bacterium]|nr:phospholipase A2 [Smithellaceae bacterium]HRS89553.1 phospholipase A2 [Smithellaceae bacterium]
MSKRFRIIFYSKTVTNTQNIIAEYDENNRLIASYIHGPNIDEPLSAEIRRDWIYYHADGLGSITALTSHMGNIVQKYEYDSFGNMSLKPHFIKQPFTYTGREFDQETGLYYYRARYYDAKVGRFITRDPIGLRGGINFYIYTKNNPINFTDPSGLYPLCGNEDYPWVPDIPYGFDFTIPCALHDLCYGCLGAMFNKTKSYCDLEFLSNMLKVCAKNPVRSILCTEVALVYYAAVVKFGDYAFQKARNCCK